MRRLGEAPHPGNGAGQRGEWPPQDQRAISAVTVLLGFGLSFVTYFLVQRQLARWQLAYGAATYALALFATLLVRGVPRLPTRRLRIVITWVLGAFILPTLFGSLAITNGLALLTGSRLGQTAPGWTPWFWCVLAGVVGIPLAYVWRRTAEQL